MTLLEQLLRDEETGPKLIALAEKYMENELIPCTDELNRLKEFLADFKKPFPLRCTGTDHLMVGPWPGGNTACGYLKNYGGPYVERP